MVGAVQAVGARPAPLRRLPAIEPAAAAKPETRPPEKTFKPEVRGIPPAPLAAADGKGGVQPQWMEAANIPFIGRALIMGYNAVKGGQVAQAPAGQLVEAVKGFDLEGIWNSGKALGQVGLQFATKSAGFAGALSLLINGYKVINHQTTVPIAGASVVGDAIGGFAGGFGGAITGGLGLTLLGMLGLAGAPLTIGAAIVGMIGYHYADKAVRRTGAYNWVVRNVYDTLNSMTSYSQRR